MVEEYLQYGKDIVYDVVHILATSNLTETNQNVDYDKITEVIQC